MKNEQMLFRFSHDLEPLEIKALDIFAARLADRQVKVDPDYVIEVRRNERCTAEEFRLSGSVDAKTLVLDYGSPAAFLYAAGKLLRDGVYADGIFTPGKWRGIFRPEKSIRCVYFASHFYNVFEVWQQRKMEVYLEDMALLGYNYVTFAKGSAAKIKGSPEDVADEQRRLALMKYANSLGMKIRYGIVNHGFADSPAEWRAKPTGLSFFGTEICVSHPQGLDYLVQNFIDAAETFKDVDVGLFQFWPYDQGGCGCEKCVPYAANGMFKLAERILPIVRKLWPNAKIIWSCWLVGKKHDNEWDMIYDRINSGKADFIDYLMIDAHANFPEYPLQHGLPGKTKMITFPEISMFGRHPWGGYGATPLPERFAGLYGEVAHLSDGGVLYSEGIFEDFTKAVYAGFFNNGHNDTAEAIREYANYELGIKPEMLNEFKRLLVLMEENHCGLVWAENGDGKILCKLKNKPVWAKAGKVWKDTDKMLEIAQNIDASLPEWAKKCWRWRLFILRAIIDFELSHNDNEPNDVTEKAMLELVDIYEVSAKDANRRVTPFTDEWIRYHIDKNFKLNLSLLGVD
ncbi:MAG: hypothetical protein E7042_02800 [Lentisphaerae bacterium]|nr:hypothetical protein [Lentisphaerota bacterium]